MKTTRRYLESRPLRLVGALIAIAATHAQAQVDQPVISPEQTAIVRLQDALAPLESRKDAATRLVGLAADDAVVNLLAGLLAPEQVAADPEPAHLIFESIRAEPTPSPKLGPLLITAAPAVPAELRPALWGAMSRFSTQGIVAALMESAQTAETPDDRALVIEALVHITGHDDFTATDQWVAWFESHRWVNELEWRRELARGLAAQRDRLLASHRSAVNRLVELSRTMYLKLEPGAQRSARLAQLLGDQEPALRQLGFDLARRELLAAAGAINGEVGAAAVKLLSSDDPGVRAQAAGLVVQLAPADGEEAIMLALAREDSPRAAAALLTGVARWPNKRACGPVMTWVQRDDDAMRAAAGQAALALARADLFEPGQVALVLDTIRPRPLLIAPEVRLLVVAGNDKDRQRVADMLLDDSPEQRRMSAEALIDRAEAFDLVAAAAEDDPALFRIAADMAHRHRPTLGGYQTIADLPAPDERAKTDSLARLAMALPPQDLFIVVSAMDGADDRLALLVPRLEDDLPDDDAQRAGLVACLLLYAETELSLAHPARALAALDRIKDEPFEDPVPMRTALAISLLATGQFEAGASIDTDADTWIRALEISIGAEHASTLLEQLRVRFADEFTDEQRATLTTLASAIDRARAEQITDAGDDGTGDG